MSSEWVKRWQRQLKKVDLYSGAIDGMFGPNTYNGSMELLDADDIDETPLSKLPSDTTPTIDQDFQYTRPLRSVRELIWHCAATPEGKHFDVSDIDKWHKQRGWSGIGYHFVVHLNGTIERGRDINRTGAHVGGRNTGTIGACYIGGVAKDGKRAKDTRTAEQREAMEWLTREIAKDPRIKTISGHNQYAAKACPSFDVQTDALGNIPGFTKGKRT